MNEEAPPSEFERELAHLINRHSGENLSNTPDYILARYLVACLHAFNSAVMRRDKWYKFRPWPSCNGGE